MNAAFIRELQENVARYGKQNVTTLLMVQAIKVIQIADAEHDRLKAANAELAAALEMLMYVHPIPSTQCSERPAYEKACAALTKHTKE